MPPRSFGSPAENQQSVFRGERRHSGTREFCRFRRSEGSGTCVDGVAHGAPASILHRSSARRRNRRALASAPAGVARSEAERAGRGAGIVQVCSAKQQKTRLNGGMLSLFGRNSALFFWTVHGPFSFRQGEKKMGGGNRPPAESAGSRLALRLRQKECSRPAVMGREHRYTPILRGATHVHRPPAGAAAGR